MNAKRTRKCSRQVEHVVICDTDVPTNQSVRAEKEINV